VPQEKNYGQGKHETLWPTHSTINVSPFSHCLLWMQG
jgi:hypothetical protein